MAAELRLHIDSIFVVTRLSQRIYLLDVLFGQVHYFEDPLGSEDHAEVSKVMHGEEGPYLYIAYSPIIM